MTFKGGREHEDAGGGELTLVLGLVLQYWMSKTQL